jgi:hypothetical protein
VEKNRVDTTFEYGEDRWIKTTGAYKAESIRPLENDRETARQTTTSQYSGVAGAGNVGEYIDGEYMPSIRMQLGPVPLAGASATNAGGPNDTDFDAKSYISYKNNRTANHNGGYFGALGNAIGAAVAPIVNALRETRKENTVGTIRPYGDAGTTVSNSYLFNPADRPVTTIRETTENSKFHLNVNANQVGDGAYTVTPQQQIANNRMNQSDFFYAGVSSAAGNSKNTRQYDAEYSQRNNDIKSSTIDGRMVPGNMALFNGEANIRQGDRNAYLANNRQAVPLKPSLPVGPENYSSSQQVRHQQLYSATQMDRNQGDVLAALKGNPYALNMTSGL